MYCYNFQVVLQEVPGKVSLCFTISGCKLRCEGCHSPFLWDEKSGTKLTDIEYKNILDRYFGFANCVVFKGGEWHKKDLLAKLKYAQQQGYETCLYTGLDFVDPEIKKHLTWVKVGRWDCKKGGLESTKTNQRFIEVDSGRELNYLFQK